MPAPATVRPQPAPEADAHDDGLHHVYCCDPDMSLCGVDLSGVPEGECTGRDVPCVVCAGLEDAPCQVCGE